MNTPSPIMPLSTAEIFWETYRSKIIAGAIIFVLLLVITGSALLVRRSQRLAAGALFTEATEASGWQKVVDRYPHSDAAANALLLIAASQRQDHQLEKATATYTTFLKTFPHHPLAISALLGKAVNSECQGNTDPALDAYQKAVLVYPKSYGAPFALLNRARLLSLLGKKEEAKRTLQLIPIQYPHSFIAMMLSRQGVAR